METWNKKKISDFAYTVSGGTPSTERKDFWQDGTIAWINSGELSQNDFIKEPTTYITEKGYTNSAAKLMPINTVVIALTGATTGMVAHLDIETTGNQSITGIFPSDEHNSRYLFYFLKNSRDKILGFNIGSAQPHINKQIVDNFEIDLPSLEQQTAIAEVLGKIDSAIEQTQKLVEKQKRIKQGLMQDLLTKGIDERGNIRDEKTHRFKDSPLGRIPEEWNVLPVYEIGNVKVGRQRSPKFQTGKFTTPYLRVANVFDCFIDYSDVLEMDFNPSEKEIYNLVQGDILLNEGQSLELVGRSAIYEGENNKFCFQNTLIRFRAFPQNDYKFCQQVFKYWLDSGKFMDVAKQTTSVAHLGSSRFAQMLFLRPELNEQQKISDIIDSQNKQIQTLQKNRAKLETTKKGLMQDLLTGKKSVENLIEI
jgi:type I restriction enzyme S subunit